MGEAVARMEMVGDDVGRYSLLKTKDVNEGKEFFDAVTEGHVGVGFEDWGPETNGAVPGVAMANEGPQLDEDIMGGRGSVLGEGLL